MALAPGTSEELTSDLHLWPKATLLQQGGIQSRSWIFSHICFSMGKKVKIPKQRNLGKKLFPPSTLQEILIMLLFFCYQNCDTRLSSCQICSLQLPHFSGNHFGAEDLSILCSFFYSLRCFYNKIYKSKQTDSLGLELCALYKILSTANIHFIFPNKLKGTCILWRKE